MQAVRWQAMHRESKDRYFLLRIWTIFLFLRAVVNIPAQTLIISPWHLFRKMIISQLELELGLPVDKGNNQKPQTELTNQILWRRQFNKAMMLFSNLPQNQW